MAQRELSILWPSKGTGQMGISRKECGKNCSGRIALEECREVSGSLAEKKVSSTPVTEIGEETLGPK